MPDLKKYATMMMLKENLEPSIEEDWKKDQSFLPGQIEYADGRPPNSGENRNNGKQQI